MSEPDALVHQQEAGRYVAERVAVGRFQQPQTLVYLETQLNRGDRWPMCMTPTRSVPRAAARDARLA